MGNVTDLAAVIAPVIDRVYIGENNGLAADVARAVIGSTLVVPVTTLTSETQRANALALRLLRLQEAFTALAGNFAKEAQDPMQSGPLEQQTLLEAADRIKALLP